MSAETSPPAKPATSVSNAPPPRHPDTAATHAHAPFRKAPWSLAILLAGLAGWLAYSYPPKHWRVPDSMLNIGALSPAPEQAKLKAVENQNLWKNTLLKFSMAGLGMGLVGIILNVRNISRRWPAAMMTLVTGVVAGAVAGALGLALRQYLDQDHPFPLVSAEVRPLVADGLVFSLISILLLLPVSVLLLFQPFKSDRHKAFAVPLAGILTGLLIPVAGALLLSGYANTSAFPPSGIDLTVLWFAGMTIFTVLIVAYHGHRPDKASATDKASAAA